MLFNSIDFLIFLPVVFLLYWFACRGKKSKNFLIVIVSYIFYGWWDWRFLFLIALTSLFSFSSGLLTEKYSPHSKARKLVSAGNIAANLLILGLFKYYNFFADNLSSLASLFGIELDLVTLNIILPVGISFYTFQALSYTIDVYQGKIRATRDIVEFFAFISFFPQLVAGPIERATNLLPQFQTNRHFDDAKAADGMRQMLWGFFKKLVIADNCAAIVNLYWDSYDHLPGVMLIILGVLFTFQIYCDFSGYSDIAIGCARLFGINLKRNFNFPYFSRSIPEFWRRWHISLTTWFRDYIYFPLGGSRCSKIKIIRNVFIVWSISGLWHGANWTFVCWGLFHASLLAVYNLLNINTKHEHCAAYGRLLPNIKEASKMLLTFCLAVIGWIIFRAEDIHEAFSYLTSIVTHPFIDNTYIDGKKWLLAGIMLLIAEWFQREKQHALEFSDTGIFRYRPARWACYYLLVYLIINYAGASQSFIYFQF
ncbi:MAG: MBOAT family protein [Prevotella sp.]|nr:MBOAT family protein [Prevotella sp.]